MPLSAAPAAHRQPGVAEQQDEGRQHDVPGVLDPHAHHQRRDHQRARARRRRAHPLRRGAQQQPQRAQIPAWYGFPRGGGHPRTSSHIGDDSGAGSGIASQ